VCCCGRDDQLLVYCSQGNAFYIVNRCMVELYIHMNI
jgi:hypothetical protein